jgi:outer membrane protein assembly factor BamE
MSAFRISNMRKLLIFIAAAATALAGGCGTVGDGLRSLGGVTNVIPNALDRAPLIYRPTVQQGNVVTQEQVNELTPGMTRRQVRFVLGTPMLTDVFHADRWDYAYTIGEGSRPEDQRRVTVFFEEDRLVRIAGDLRPQPPGEREEAKKEVVVTVPDWEPERKSLWRRALDGVGLETKDD